MDFIKISFKEHTQAFIRDRLSEEEGDSKSVVAEFQNKKFFLNGEKNMDNISLVSSNFLQSFQFRVSASTFEIVFGIKTLLLHHA